MFDYSKKNECNIEHLYGTLSSQIPSEQHPVYDGPTQVKPNANNETVLLTADKIVNKDIIVEKIPYYENDNVGGGLTVYIGE